MKILTINRIYSDNLGDQFLSIQIKSHLEEVLNYKTINYDLLDSKLTTRPNLVLNRKNNKFKNIIKKYLFSTQISRNIYWYIKNKKNIKKIIKKENPNLIIFGGGELIQDNEYFPIAIKTWSKYAKKNNIPYYFFGVGVKGRPRKSQLKKLLSSLRDSSGTVVRDLESKNTLLNDYNIEENVEVSYDVGFLDINIPKEKSDKYALLGVTSYRRIKKHLNIYENEKEYYDSIIKRYGELKHKYGECYTFYTDNEDKRESILLSEKYNLKYIEYDNLDELISVIKDSSFIETPRMHGCIMGIVNGIDTNPVKISSKMRSFYKTYYSKTKNIKTIQKEISDSLRELTSGVSL